MKQSAFFLSLVSVTLLAGCSDPSDKVQKAAAADPRKADTAAAATGKEFTIRSSSTIGFIGSKVTGSHHGGFKNFAGKINVAGDKIAGSPEITINMKTTWADQDRLTKHLQSPDFFDVAKYPLSTFSVTALEPAADSTKVTGNLNLHGVSKSISFPAKIQITGDQVSLKAEFAINRREFNINYAGMANDLIRDNVVIALDIQATPGPAKPEDLIAN